MAGKNHISDTSYSYTYSNTKIHVGGLSRDTQKDTLKKYFEQFGEIQEAVVIMDEFTGRSKGYGFVTFKNPDAAAEACQDPFPLIDGTIGSCNFANLDEFSFLNSTPAFCPYSNQQPQYTNWFSMKDQDMYSDQNVYSSSRVMNSWITESSLHGTTYMPIKIREMAKALQCGEARDKNFVFSPCSIQLALSLLSNGSNGSTLSKFLTFLDAKDLNQLNCDATKQIDSLTGTTNNGGLSFVGGLWVQKSLTLSSTFKEKAEKSYRAQARELDFENDSKVAIGEVNRWAEESTNGLIKSILPPNLSPNTVIVLGNAVYFKSNWIQKFYKRDTREYAFYLSDQTKEFSGQRVTAPFMTSTESKLITCFKDFKVLKLPYERNSSLWLSMYIILPNQVHGIWDLIDTIGSDPSFFNTYIRRYDFEFVDVKEFRIPKFKATTELEASGVLNSIGLEEPFSDRAEFDQMVPGAKPGKLRVSNVFHKAQIYVDEEGSEAVAVTAITVNCFGAGAPVERPPPVDFVADHPFMFMVRDDESRTVLFMGYVMNPLF